MVILNLLVFLLIWSQKVLSEEQAPTSAAEISEINNLRSANKGELRLDPALRRALLQVLNRMEEEEKNKLVEDVNSQNVVTEEDFIKFLSSQEATKELLQNLDSTKNDNYEENTDPTETKDEILAYSQEDSGSDEAPSTSVTFDGENLAVHQKPEEEEEEKYPSTQSTPQENAIYFQVPEPIQIPDPIDEQVSNVIVKNESLNVQETRSIQGPTLNTFTENDKSSQKGETYKEVQKVSETVESFPSVEAEKETENSTKAEKVEKHAVEFFTAPLLAAFTVQQDEKGVPRRVIPLNYQKPGPILLPNNKEVTKEELNKQFELEEKQRVLENQVKFLQQQQLQQQEYLRLQEFARETKRLQEEETRRQLLLEQQRVAEIEQRLVQARQRQQQLLSNQKQEFEQGQRNQNFLFQNSQGAGLLDVKNSQSFQNNQRPEFEQQRNQQNNVLFQNNQGTGLLDVKNSQSFQNNQRPEFEQQRNQQNNVLFQNNQGTGLLDVKNSQSFQNNQRPEFEQQRNQQNNVLFQNNQGTGLLDVKNSQSFQNNQRPDFEQQRNQQNNFLFQNSQRTELEDVKNRQLLQNQRPELQQQRQEFLELERQRYRNQNVDFQRSVDFQFRQPQNFNNFQPFPELNRVNRREPNNFVGNFGINQPQVTADSQLQNLLFQSGIANNFKGKTEAQEDLNIVSKVLALNHGSHLQQFLPRLQFQGSDKVYSVVSPPSTVIQPPKF